MMVVYCTYDESDSVLQVGRCHASHADDIIEDCGGRFAEIDPDYYDKAFVERYLVRNPRGGVELIEKKEVGVVCQVSGLTATLSNLPAGTRVSVGGGGEMVADGDDEIVFDAPGTYDIEITPPPPKYLDETLEVTVG